MLEDARPARGFPLAGGLLLGLGLGGFVDGIAFHQILQWHHVASGGIMPAPDVAAMRAAVRLDGLFQAGTLALVALGLAVVLGAARRARVLVLGRLVAGSILMGFGLFNLVEGAVSHQVLGLHHVNETVPRDRWLAWDLGFLGWGALMLGAGALLWGTGRREELRIARARR